MAHKKVVDANYPYIRLKYSLDMILCLNDFIYCIGLHKEDLKEAKELSKLQVRDYLIKRKN